MRADAWWFAQANGRVVDVPFGSRADLFQLSAPRQGDPPPLVSLVTQWELATPEAPTVDGRVLIHVDYGNARVAMPLVVDAGQAFTVAASTINAWVEALGGDSRATPVARVRAFLALASSHGGSLPTLTDEAASVLAAATSPQWRIPACARDLSILTSYNTAVGANLFRVQWCIVGSFGTTVVLESATQGGGTATGATPWFTVPKYATHIQVINAGPAASTVQPQWRLAP